MKKVIYTMAISLSSLSFFAQKTEMRTVSEFTKIDASGAAQVVISQGEPGGLTVSSTELTSLDKIVTEVKGNTLYIYDKGDLKGDYKVTCSLRNLEGINASGAAYVKSDSTFNADVVNLEASGASKIKLDIICKEIKSNATGAATLSLSGATETHTLFAAGAASVKAYKLSTITSDVTAAGAASVKINVNQKLKADVAGAGSLKYMGTPSDKTINLSGAGEVKQVDGDEVTIRLNDTDTTSNSWRSRFPFDKKDYKVKWNNDFNHWAGIELNLNGYIGKSGDISLPATDDYMSINYGVHSLSWNLNLAEKDFHLYKNYLNLVTGIGFGFNSYQFKNPIQLNPDSSYTYYTTATGVNFNKNKLKTAYLQIPLLLECNTSKKPEKSFHIAVGVIGGYKLGSKTYSTYEINGYNFTEKRKDDYNINPFKLDATARIGFGPFTMFGTYSLTHLFETNKGPQLNAFTFGVRIIPF